MFSKIVYCRGVRKRLHVGKGYNIFFVLGPIFETAIQHPDVVGEQEVVVNVMTFDSEEEELTQDIDVRDTTPGRIISNNLIFLKLLN